MPMYMRSHSSMAPQTTESLHPLLAQKPTNDACLKQSGEHHDIAAKIRTPARALQFGMATVRRRYRTFVLAIFLQNSILVKARLI